MPRKFFDQHVRLNYDEWLAEPLDERRAKNAVADANNMAARVYHHWKDTDRARVFDANSEGEYASQNHSPCSTSRLAQSSGPLYV